MVVKLNIDVAILATIAREERAGRVNKMLYPALVRDTVYYLQKLTGYTIVFRYTEPEIVAVLNKYPEYFKKVDKWLYSLDGLVHISDIYKVLDIPSDTPSDILKLCYIKS